MISIGVLCVDRIAPTVGFTSPPAGDVAGVVNVAVNAADNDAISMVQFLCDGALLGNDAAAPYQVSQDTRSLVNGSHTYLVTAWDRVGNLAQASRVVNFRNYPFAAMTAPGAGNVAGVVTLSASVTHYSSQVTVQFQVDGSNVGGAQVGGSGSYSYQYDTRALLNGSHNFRVVATDAQGNQTISSAVAVTFVNVPVTAMTAPAAGNVAGVITVSANVTQYSSQVTVQFQADGANIGSPQTGGSGGYSIQYDTRALVNGGHTFRVVATDLQGNQTISGGVATTFRNLPVINLYTPGNGATVTGNIQIGSYVTQYGTSVTVNHYVDGSFVGGGSGGTGYYASNVIDTHNYAVGWHTFTCIATDAQGNSSRVDYSMYVNNQPPAAGYTYFGDMMVWYGGDDGPGYYEYRAAPGGDWFADAGDGNWFWAYGGEGGGRYWAAHIPGNPDPAHYQMWTQAYGGYVEGGSDGNIVHLAFWIDGAGPYEWFRNGNTGASWAVGGGNGFQCGRYQDWQNNTCHCADVRVYYWFTVKGGS